jgi:hypothetical protein
VNERLDALYRERPEAFVAARNAMVKELRATGDRDEAGRVGKLRRPSVPAWLLNRAALDAPDRLKEFDEASRQLEAAQERALGGKDDAAADWRAAAGREREASDAVLDAAGRLARDSGHPASDRALELAAETLRAASGDPELRDQVLRGRLDRERSAATLGRAAADGARPKRRAAKRDDGAKARRELKRLERELASAAKREELLAAQVDEAAATLRDAKKRLAAGKRETTDLRRRVKAAERRAGG